MKEVLMRTKPKDSFTLVVSDNSANIQTNFSSSTEFTCESGNVLFIRKYSKRQQAVQIEY